SIRTFNTDDQLSIEVKKQVSIIPNIQDISIEEVTDSFTDFLPPSAIIWFEDAAYIKEKMNNIFSQILAREEAGLTSGKKELIMTGSRFLEECGKFRTVEFGRTAYFNPSEGFSFRSEPQPV